MFSFIGFAQRTAHIINNPINSIADHPHTGATSRTTAIGDTLILSHIFPADTLTIYSYGADSGYVTGTNAFGDMGFAERYDVNGTDSSIVVLGVMAEFGGKVNPSSAKNVQFMLWGVSDPIVITSSFGYDGFPQNGYDTITIPVTGLGIGPSSDTLKTFLFPFPNIQNYNFFIGYTISYNFLTLAGDTLGLLSSKNGERTSLHYNYTVIPDSEGASTYHNDTLINVQNATQWSDGNWYDNYAENDSLYNDLAIFPVVAINNPTGLNKVTRNNLSLYGNFPNPAVNTTNIKFSLSKSSDVTIQIAEMSGRILKTIPNNSLSPGEHVVPISTENMASGNYLYILHTSGGDAIAGQLSVVR